ncbi:MAG: type II toxin-antitoxin system RelE/ParE family toxin [Acidaminococcaceae bacterium]|nr:type II toxin-antitoxin system RelE/ParE family toxin [Acidaminococcaceae bacterium]
MKKLAYSPHCKEKIVKLRKYLDFHFGTQVRRKVFKEIDERIHLLQRFESMGISIREVYDIDCDYFCVYVAKNYVFYRVDSDTVYIVNIYNEREDFMQKMFGIELVKDDE